MRVQHHVLQGAQTLDAASLVPDSLHVVLGRGRGARLQLPPGWVSVWLVLSGSLEMGSHDNSWSLPSRQFQLWLDGGLRAVSLHTCWWISVSGTPRMWEEPVPSATTPCNLFPWQASCPRKVMRPLIQLARLRKGGSSRSTPQIDETLALLRNGIIEDTQELQMRMQHCSGRTRMRRQQTLLRLLRVQHLIRCHLEDRIELTRLAASANYSPCHLIRIYREVFGETPSEYATRLRCQRALALVQNTDLSICEIAEMLGFESESAFCRAFKHAFGCTTSVIRRQQRDSGDRIIPATSMAQ